MIVRRIPPKESRAGGFARLGHYITAAIVPEGGQGAYGGAAVLGAYIAGQAGHSDRVEWVRITNCNLSDSLKAAIREIDATQTMNARMKADPNYHLLVSFPPGEIPAREQIEDIEDTLVAGLGLSGHQRLSALHADKAHLHLHVAINLIDPETYRAAGVWKDYEKLQQMAVQLEIKHGLERTDHTMPLDRGRGEPVPMEAHTAREPFTGWVSRVAGAALLEAGLGQGGWQALHEAASRYGLEFRQRGAGLVIGKIGEPALNMKASDLDRGLGYKQLVARFGAYEPAGEKARTIRPEASYTRIVPPERRANSDLWARYVAARDSALRAKAALDGPAKKYIQDLNAHYRAEFAKVKNWRTEMFDPRLRIQTLKQNRERDMTRFRGRMKAQRADLAARQKVQNWPDWLRGQAERGETAAADELRRQAAQAERSRVVLIRTPSDTARVARNPEFKPKVTRGGDIVYRLPDGGAVVDKAEGLHMPMVSHAAAMLILDLARARAGNQPLSVNGTPAQAEAIMEAAVQLRANITFADPGMEAERQRRLGDVLGAGKAQGNEPVPVTMDAARAMPLEELQSWLDGDAALTAAREGVETAARQLAANQIAFEAAMRAAGEAMPTSSARTRWEKEASDLYDLAVDGKKTLAALQEALQVVEARPDLVMLRAVLAEKQAAEREKPAAQVHEAGFAPPPEPEQDQEWEF